VDSERRRDRPFVPLLSWSQSRFCWVGSATAGPPIPRQGQPLGGRPELESDTPVNIGNGPYRDNGEGVAATPLSYPPEPQSVSGPDEHHQHIARFLA